MDSNSIHRAAIETAGVVAEVMQALNAAGEHALTLKHVAAAAHDATAEVYGDSGSADLRECASRIRGVVLHGLTVLAELQGQAGRLDGLAATRRAVEHAEATGE